MEVDGELVLELLGKPRFRPRRKLERSEIGVATGLAWTEAGGEVLGTEGGAMGGEGNLPLNGKFWVLVQEVGENITIEPMRGFPVERDLIVNMEGFFSKYRAMQPYLQTESPEPARERLQSPEERARFDDTTK